MSETATTKNRGDFWTVTMPDHDPGDEASSRERERCPGPLVAADQTLLCNGCGVAWWSEENDLFEAVHGPETELR